MDRFTQRDNDLGYCLVGDSFYVDERWSDLEREEQQFCCGDAIDRLAAYEDTGLTPEEVDLCVKYEARRVSKREMKLGMENDRLRDELERVTETTDGISLDRLEAICTAERDGRCLVLPCKVGDTVYALQSSRISELCVDPLHKEIVVAKVIEITLEDDVKWLRLYSDDDRMADYRGENFGRTVFLTRAEAEAALAAERKGE